LRADDDVVGGDDAGEDEHRRARALIVPIAPGAEEGEDDEKRELAHRNQTSV
jgi:hypothetical protein